MLKMVNLSEGVIDRFSFREPGSHSSPIVLSINCYSGSNVHSFVCRSTVCLDLLPSFARKYF